MKKLAELIRSVIKEEVRAIVRDEVKGLVKDVEILKQKVTQLEQDVAEIKKDMATKAELMSMEQRFTASVEKIREALRLSMLEVHSDLENIKVKLKMYNFDFLLKQNDHFAEVLKYILEKRKALLQRMKDFEDRLKTVEAA